MSNAVAIIPARGGSTRIPRKNIREFRGRPILAYSVDVARVSGLFSDVIVSTEDAEIAAIATALRCVVHQRSFADAADDVGTQRVMCTVLRDMGIRSGHACCIYATAPLLIPGDLVRASAHKRGFAVAVGTEPLRDAGAFYWGPVAMFRAEAALYSDSTALVPLPEDRVCDINTPEDWERAERMYEARQA